MLIFCLNKILLIYFNNNLSCSSFNASIYSITSKNKSLLEFLKKKIFQFGNFPVNMLFLLSKPIIFLYVDFLRNPNFKNLFTFSSFAIININIILNIIFYIPNFKFLN